MVAKAGESELSTISTGFLSLSFSINISKQPTKPSESQGEDKFLGSSTRIIWVLNYINFLFTSILNQYFQTAYETQ